MNRFVYLSAAVLAVTLGIAPSVDSAASAQPGRGRASDRMALSYVGKAAAADLYEIESSRLAVRNTRRAEVRAFARMLITDHMRTTEQLAAAARADGVAPPRPMLEPAQRAMIRQLERTRAPAFDRAYTNQQVTAHRQALALHRDYARTGRGVALRRAAAGAVPVIQGHLAQAQRLARGR